MMLIYFFAVQICLLLLWAIYHWSFSTLRQFRFNRVYLWLVPILSLSIPLLEIEIGVTGGSMQAIAYPTEISSFLDSLPLDTQYKASNKIWNSIGALSGDWLGLIGVVYWIGCGILGLRSLKAVLYLKRKLKRSKPRLFSKPNIYRQSVFAQSFAFGKRIYLGSDWDALDQEERDVVLKHEQAHIQLGHRYDLYYFHLIRMLFWFHPAAHFLVRSAKHLHEFEADKSVIDTGLDFSTYAKVLLKLQSKHPLQTPLVFAFAEHPLTIRIKMLKTKTNWLQSSKRHLLAIAMIGSLITGVGYYFNSFGWLQVQLNPKAAYEQANLQAISPQRTSPQVVKVAEITPSQTYDPDKPELSPIDAPIVSGFGMRTHPITKQKKRHAGVDYRIATGTPVRASARGKVVMTNMEGNYGKQVLIQHANGYQTRYAHLDKILVKEGDSVEQGKVIALSGDTGKSKSPHLHYEVILNGRAVDPVPLFK